MSCGTTTSAAAPAARGSSLPTCAPDRTRSGRGAPCLPADAGAPGRAAQVKPLALTDDEMDDLVEFLKTLTGAPLPAAQTSKPVLANVGAANYATDAASSLRARGWLSPLPLSLAAVARADAGAPARGAAPCRRRRRRRGARADALALDTQSQLEDLRQKMYDLEQQLEQTRQVATLRRPIVNVNGYVDFGFFVPEGTGAGIVAGLGRWPPSGAFPSTRISTAGCSWATCWRRPSTRAARWPTSASSPGIGTVRRRRLERRARVHRQRGQPDPERRARPRPRSPPPA